MRVGVEVIVGAGLIIGGDERDVRLAHGVINGLVKLGVAHGLVVVGAPGGVFESFVFVFLVCEANLGALGQVAEAS